MLFEPTPLLMNIEPKIKVVDTLISNLKTQTLGMNWKKNHPLIQKYIEHMNEPHRIHHGWKYVANMLDEMEQLPHHYVPEVLRFTSAVLFSKIVYVPGAQDNEEESVIFASQFYQGANLSKLDSLILSTCDNRPFALYGDDRDVMCDITLSVLGSPRETFTQYRLDLVKEYKGFCTALEFDLESQTFFLEMLRRSEKEGIFRTEWFKTKYERSAQENLLMALGL